MNPPVSADRPLRSCRLELPLSRRERELIMALARDCRLQYDELLRMLLFESGLLGAVPGRKDPSTKR